MAQRMLARAFAAAVPATWVTGDEIYGDDGAFRRWLAVGDHPYVLAVFCSHPVWLAGMPERADRLIAVLPPEAWAPVGGRGEPGRAGLRLGLHAVALPEFSGDGLLARRSLSDPTAYTYYRVFGPAETPIAEMVRVAGMR